MSEKVVIDQKYFKKDLTFTDQEVLVLGYKLIQITTNGDLRDVSYKVEDLDGKVSPEIEASLCPNVIGPVRAIKLTNDTAETGKRVWVTMFTGPDELLACIWSGSLRAMSLALSDINKLRFGYYGKPSWILGSEIIAPVGYTELVSKTVSAGVSGFLYGFIISAPEANHFKIEWTSGGVLKTLRIIAGGAGTIKLVHPIPLNEGLPCDAGQKIDIVNVNAGSAGLVYQAQILIGEFVLG